jgi:hypothetical protein
MGKGLSTGLTKELRQLWALFRYKRDIQFLSKDYG